MSLVTTCPSCGTMFKFDPMALTSHGGEGRCSVCHQVFNALAHVTHISNNANTATLESSATEEVTHTFLEEDGLAAALPIVPDTSEPFVPDEFADEQRTEITDAPTIKVPENLFQKKRFAWPSLIKLLPVSIALLFIALIQAALFFRAQVVNHLPASFSLLDSLCKPLSCTVPLPHQAALVSIEDYRLRSHPDYNDVLILESTLHNRAPYPLALPALKLTLTDDFNAPVASRTLTPADYLPKEANALQGMKEKTSISFQIHIGVAGIKSSNYSLLVEDVPEASGETPS